MAIVADADDTGALLASVLEEAGLDVMRFQPDGGPVRVAEGQVEVLLYASDTLAAADLEAIAELSDVTGAERRVAVASEMPPAHAMRRAIRRCVDGIVLLADAEAALVPTLRAVCAEQLVMPGHGRDAIEVPLLSHREREILGMAVDGLTNDEIARRLYLATSTVKSHLSTAFAKLSVRSRTEAASVLHELEGELPPVRSLAVEEVG